MPRLIVLFAIMLVSTLLIACQEAEPTELPEPTVTPTATAQPTVTPTPTPTATPTPPPRPRPTVVPLNVSAGSLQLLGAIADYSEQCGMSVPYYWVSGGIWGPLFDDTITWAAFVQDIDLVLATNDEIEPPLEVKDYHSANLDAWRSFRTEASARPAGNLVSADLDTFTNELIRELLVINADSNITNDEKERHFREIPEQRVTDFVGQGAYSSEGVAQEILETLSPLARSDVERAHCVGPIVVLGLDWQARRAASLRTDASWADASPLVTLYNATDGPNWRNNTNWLTGAPQAIGSISSLVRVMVPSSI